MQTITTLTDDQVALIGCAVALLVTGTIMSLSFYLGKGRKQEDVTMNAERDSAAESSKTDRARRAA